MWAKNKGVYSQIFCYLGGIGYTILLAKVCQFYPNYGPLKLGTVLFLVFPLGVGCAGVPEKPTNQ